MKPSVGGPRATRLMALCALSLVVFLVLSAPLLAQDADSEQSVPPGSAQQAPVTLDGYDIFAIGPGDKFGAAERAEEITNRIEQAAAQGERAPPVSIVQHEKGYSIIAGAVRIVEIDQKDIEASGLESGEPSAYHQTQLEEAIARYRVDRELGALSLDAGLAVFWTLALVAAFTLFERPEALCAKRSVPVWKNG